MTAIFLHSGWRTGSTYLWHKFRQAPGTLAFYEPFHELLGGRADRLGSLRPAGTSHHPRLTAPYFAEYQPLVEGNAVRSFLPEFSYRRFFLEPDQPDPELRCYLEQLLDRAAGLGRIPVLGFSRSLGRTGWLKRAVPSHNLLITRDPRRQWASILHQKNRYGIPYFFENQFLICGQNRDHPRLRPLIAVYDIPLVRTSSTFNDMAAYHRLLDGVGDGNGYLVFYYLWLITHLSAREHADLVIDVDRLAADPACRQETAAAIRARTGLALSFEDADTTSHGVGPPEPDLGRIEDFVRGLVTGGLGLAAGDRP
jgi:hypothetical protein